MTKMVAVSGAVCASSLARNGVSVTIFESARGPGGRMSQRRFFFLFLFFYFLNIKGSFWFWNGLKIWKQRSCWRWEGAGVRPRCSLFQCQQCWGVGSGSWVGIKRPCCWVEREFWVFWLYLQQICWHTTGLLLFLVCFQCSVELFYVFHPSKLIASPPPLKHVCKLIEWYQFCFSLFWALILLVWLSGYLCSMVSSSSQKMKIE